MLCEHFPAHSSESIFQSLCPDLKIINAYNLNMDKKGRKQILDYAFECGILKQSIDIDAFADKDLSTEITKH
jgi:hypothetical protein